MKATLRYAVFVALLFGIWAIAANEIRAQDRTVANADGPKELQACNSVEPELTDDSARWRLRAYNSLDCLIGRIEQALKRPGDPDNNTMAEISREELEQLRTLAWWAKDAAARIGR